MINTEIFLTVLKQMTVLFLIIITGYIVRKKEIITDSTVNSLMKFVTLVTLPAIIFSAMQIENDPVILLNAVKCFLYSTIFFSIGILCGIITSRILKLKPPIKGAWGVCFWSSGVIFVGLPVANALFGENAEAMFYMSVTSTSLALFMFTVGLYFIARDSSETKADITWKLFFNPCIIAFLIGLAFIFFPFSAPSAVMDAVSMVGGITTPLIMIVLGALMTRCKIKELFTDRKIYFVSAFKLLILPVLFNFIFRGIISDHLLFSVLLVCIALPTPSTAVALVSQHNGAILWTVKYVVVSTVFSIITIPVIVMIFIGNV